MGRSARVTRTCDACRAITISTSTNITTRTTAWHVPTDYNTYQSINQSKHVQRVLKN